VQEALSRIAKATQGTPYEGQLWLVGGAVRDQLLGLPDSHDLDIVLEQNALELAEFLHQEGITESDPVIYPRFGTAMVRVAGMDIELVTARSESYDHQSRKPHVRASSLRVDANRRDATVNTLLRNLHSSELHDPLGSGLDDLSAGILRTPIDAHRTFHDDPLRMLRLVRFRWQLGFALAEGLEQAIRDESKRLEIVSRERIRDEWDKIISLPLGDRALQQLADLRLLEVFGKDLTKMQGVEQGSFHHLDVWQHSLLVLKRVAPADRVLRLAALLHDIGKPATRTTDAQGNIRFFGHESKGASLAEKFLSELKYPGEVIDSVVLLVRHHMRLGSASTLTPPAVRRLARDLGPLLDRLLILVRADQSALRPGVQPWDVDALEAQIREELAKTPVDQLQSPLSGDEIMRETGWPEGPRVGQAKTHLLELVLEGTIRPGDKATALEHLQKLRQQP